MISVLIMLLGQSCNRPNFSKSELVVPQQWPITSFAHNKTVDLAQLHWWKQFKNSELDALTQKTLAQNTELKIAVTHIEQAQSQLDQIKLSWIPGLNFLAGYTQFPDLGNTGALAIAYPAYLVNIMQLYQQQKSAKARYEASHFAHDGVKVALIARTVASFFVLLEQKQAQFLYQRLLAHSNQYLLAIKTQFQSGLIAEDQIVAQTSKIRLIESELDLIQANLVASKNALHYLLDESPGEIKITSLFSQIDTTPLIPGNQPISVIENRPDVRQAEALLNAAHADTQAIKALFFPEINLGAYLGSSGNQGQVKLGQAFAAGPLIDLAVFARIKGAQAQTKEAFLHYKDTVLRALRDVTNDLAAFNAYDTQFQNNVRALHDAQKLCTLVQDRYNNGLEDKLSTLQCAINVDQLTLQINHNKLEKMLALVSLYQDLGGGYRGN